MNTFHSGPLQQNGLFKHTVYVNQTGLVQNSLLLQAKHVHLCITAAVLTAVLLLFFSFLLLTLCVRMFAARAVYDHKGCNPKHVSLEVGPVELVGFTPR